MERRAASHTEEEEMNQRRKLLNAARRGDAKAISKLFELYQVRVLSGDQLAKVNRTSTYMVPLSPSRGGKQTATGPAKRAKSVAPTPGKVAAKKRAKVPLKSATRKRPKVKPATKRKAKHK